MPGIQVVLNIQRYQFPGPHPYRAAARSQLCTLRAPPTTVWPPPAFLPRGRGRCRRHLSVGFFFEINAAVCFAARRQHQRKLPHAGKGWWQVTDAARSPGLFLPLLHSGNALLPAQRSFILMAETFIVPKELVQYNSPLCAAASPMSHMQSQGKTWILQRALHDPSAQRYIQLKQCYFCLIFWWLLEGDTDEDNGRESVCEPCRHFMSFHLQTRREKKNHWGPDVPNCPAAAESELAVSASTCTSWFFTSPYVCSDTCDSSEQATWQLGHSIRAVHAVLEK